MAGQGTHCPMVSLAVDSPSEHAWTEETPEMKVFGPSPSRSPLFWLSPGLWRLCSNRLLQARSVEPRTLHRKQQTPPARRNSPSDASTLTTAVDPDGAICPR